MDQQYEDIDPSNRLLEYVCRAHGCCVLDIFAVDANFIVVFLAVQLAQSNEPYNKTKEERAQQLLELERGNDIPDRNAASIALDCTEYRELVVVTYGRTRCCAYHYANVISLTLLESLLSAAWKGRLTF